MTLKRTAFLRKPPDVDRLTVTLLRARKCLICFTRFTPDRENVTWCGAECGYLVSQQELAKKDRIADRAKREAMKDRGDHIEAAQTAFNAWVRARDADLPCICCGKFSTSKASIGGKWDAGHYLSRGSHPHLRFDERNVFKQRKGCNRPGGTTAASFRLGVIKRIGLEAVEALESTQGYCKWTIEELIEIKNEYRAKLRALTNSRTSA